MFSTSITLSQFLAAKHKNSHIGNVNVIQSGSGESKAICHIPYMHPFSYDSETPTNAYGQYEGLAAVLLAMDHLNTGNGTIVPELDKINERCPLQFSTETFDTREEPRLAIEKVIAWTDRSKFNGEGETKDLLPCAILGAAVSGISMPTSIITGFRGFPQISPISTSPKLDDKKQYKLFGRTIPNDDGTAIPLIDKLSEWKVRYLAVLHNDDPYGNSFAWGIHTASEREGINVRVEIVSIPVDADDDTIAAAIKRLKGTGFTYFFGIIYPDQIDRAMTEAHAQGIAGTGQHMWLFSDSVGTTAIGRNFTVGSPLEQAYRGTGVLSARGGVQGMDAFDKLALSLQQMKGNADDMSFFEAHLPQELDRTQIISQESFLETPGLVAPFLYDAVVALGLGACNLTMSSEKNEYFTGEELYSTFLNTSFVGASGSIIINPSTGTRNPQSALFAMTNAVEDADASVAGVSVQFKEADSEIYNSGKWESRSPFIFNDGTSDIPSDLPAIETNSNYLNNVVTVVGLIMIALIVALSFGFGLWTKHNSKKYAVRASQPIFLYIIIAGTALMGLSIVPLLIDLGVAGQEGANAACMSFPWLLTIGFSLTFSALFTKTYRVNQLMKSAHQYQRLVLTATDVMKPMIALLVLNAIVLTVWTVHDPLQRETIIVLEDPFGRALETYGVCASDHGYIFLIVLCVINLGSLFFAVVQAYRARKLDTELQESSSIFLAMSFILLVSFIGLPVAVIARDSDDTQIYCFVLSGMIFVVCASILLLIFAPKVNAVRESNKNKRAAQSGHQHIRLTRRASNDSYGIKILNLESELKEEKRVLEEENCVLEEENCELKRLLSSRDVALGDPLGEKIDSDVNRQSHNKEPDRLISSRDINRGVSFGEGGESGGKSQHDNTAVVSTTVRVRDDLSTLDGEIMKPQDEANQFVASIKEQGQGSLHSPIALISDNDTLRIAEEVNDSKELANSSEPAVAASEHSEFVKEES